MTAEEQARTIARAICVEYRLSPERYEASGGEHPIIPVIVRHFAPALAAAESLRGNHADLIAMSLREGARVEMLERAIRHAIGSFPAIRDEGTQRALDGLRAAIERQPVDLALTKLDQQDGQ